MLSMGGYLEEGSELARSMGTPFDAASSLQRGTIWKWRLRRRLALLTLLSLDMNSFAGLVSCAANFKKRKRSLLRVFEQCLAFEQAPSSSRGGGHGGIAEDDALPNGRLRARSRHAEGRTCEF